MNKSIGMGVRKIGLLLLSIGPAVFGIGYTIGTGSVTSMCKAGSQYGTQLLWVLALSCFFSWALMEAYGRYALVTGQTAIHAFKTRLKFGKTLAILVAIGIITGQWCCLSGLVGLSSNLIYEALRMAVPSLPASSYWAVLAIAVFILICMYLLLLVGRYSFFEKVLLCMVSVLGITFIVSMAIVLPPAKELAAGFVPSIPNVPGANLMVAAFVGTTMAGPTFIVRPLLLKSKGWTIDDMKKQQHDSVFYGILTFIISGSIMICATGTLFKQGIAMENVLDMVKAIEPVAGQYAVVLFLLGAVSAGVSSILPILMVAPLLKSDYQKGVLDAKSKSFRILAAIGCLMGLIVPISGRNPIVAQIATQVSLVFVLPLVVLCIMMLVNDKKQMGEYKAGIVLNICLTLALVFSLVISYTGVSALIDFF